MVCYQVERTRSIQPKLDLARFRCRAHFLVHVKREHRKIHVTQVDHQSSGISLGEKAQITDHGIEMFCLSNRRGERVSQFVRIVRTKSEFLPGGSIVGEIDGVAFLTQPLPEGV